MKKMEHLTILWPSCKQRIIGETAANTLLNAKSWMHDGNFANGTQPEVSCWQKATSARLKYSQVVYR